MHSSIKNARRSAIGQNHLSHVDLKNLVHCKYAKFPQQCNNYFKELLLSAFPFIRLSASTACQFRIIYTISLHYAILLSSLPVPSYRSHFVICPKLDCFPVVQAQQASQSAYCFFYYVHIVTSKKNTLRLSKSPSYLAQIPVVAKRKND